MRARVCVRVLGRVRVRVRGRVRAPVCMGAGVRARACVRACACAWAWAPAVGITHLGVLYPGMWACYIRLRSGWGSDGNVYKRCAARGFLETKRGITPNHWTGLRDREEAPPSAAYQGDCVTGRALASVTAVDLNLPRRHAYGACRWRGNYMDTRELSKRARRGETYCVPVAT